MQKTVEHLSLHALLLQRVGMGKHLQIVETLMFVLHSVLYILMSSNILRSGKII